MSHFTQQPRIRHMKAGDLDQVFEIAGSLNRAPQWPRRVYEAALNPRNTPRRIALVAEDAPTKRVFGFVVARFLSPEAELESIAVAAEFQRRGVARQLFWELAVELRREQASKIVLEVRTSNQPAQTFYRSLGFGEAGRRPSYYTDPVEDAVLMLLRLAAARLAG